MTTSKRIAEDLLFCLCLDEIVKGKNLISYEANYDDNKKLILVICFYIAQNYMNRISGDELVKNRIFLRYTLVSFSKKARE